jgi:hypothetical protein
VDDACAFFGLFFGEQILHEFGELCGAIKGTFFAHVLFEVVAHLVGALVTLVGVLFQRAHDDVFEGFGVVGPKLAGDRHACIADGIDDFGFVPSSEQGGIG